VAFGLEDVNWTLPWLEPWRAVGLPITQTVGSGMPLATALNAAGASPVQFVPQWALPEGEPYERFIFQNKQCPTRDNLHDFFNGLCWHLLPRTKHRINQLQAHDIAARGVQATRGPVRDALTLFDENGALLHAPALLWQALLAHDWHALFVTHRALWQQAHLLIVGHALLEKLVYPRKQATAHVLIAQATLDSVASADAWLAQVLSAQWLASKPFTPLQVLGVPDWWAHNEIPAFYDDTQVFRPKPLANAAAE
jgi:hypothetical protein